MVERMPDMPAGTLGFRVAGDVERDDYEDVLIHTSNGWRIQRRMVSGRWQLSADQPDTPAHRRTF